jgi:hypothetical protein
MSETDRKYVRVHDIFVSALVIIAIVWPAVYAISHPDNELVRIFMVGFRFIGFYLALLLVLYLLERALIHSKYYRSSIFFKELKGKE